MVRLAAIVAGVTMLAACNNAVPGPQDPGTAPAPVPTVTDPQRPAPSDTGPGSSPTEPVDATNPAPPASDTAPSTEAPTPSETPTPPEPPGPTAIPTDLSGDNHAYVTGVDVTNRIITVDVVYFLTGTEAINHIKEAPAKWENLPCDDTPSGVYEGGDTANCWLPNDYFIANDNPKLRDLQLSPTATVKLIDMQDCCAGKLSTLEALADLVADSGGEPWAPFRFTVSPQGFVTDVTQIFIP